MGGCSIGSGAGVPSELYSHSAAGGGDRSLSIGGLNTAGIPVVQPLNDGNGIGGPSSCGQLTPSVDYLATGGGSDARLGSNPFAVQSASGIRETTGPLFA